MLESFLTVLASTVANKKVLGAWLVLLTLAMGQMASAVYVNGGSKAAVVSKEIENLGEKIDALAKTVEGMNTKLGDVSGTVLVLKDRSDKAEQRGKK